MQTGFAVGCLCAWLSLGHTGDSAAVCDWDTLMPQEGIWPPAVTHPVLLHCCIDHSVTARQELVSLCSHWLISHPRETHDAEEQGGNSTAGPFHASTRFSLNLQ